MVLNISIQRQMCITPLNHSHSLKAHKKKCKPYIAMHNHFVQLDYTNMFCDHINVQYMK
jgi:hypothetical protein